MLASSSPDHDSISTGRSTPGPWQTRFTNAIDPLSVTAARPHLGCLLHIRVTIRCRSNVAPLLLPRTAQLTGQARSAARGGAARIPGATEQAGRSEGHFFCVWFRGRTLASFEARAASRQIPAGCLQVLAATGPRCLPYRTPGTATGIAGWWRWFYYASART